MVAFHILIFVALGAVVLGAIEYYESCKKSKK